MLKHGVWRTGGLIYTQPHPPLCPIPSQNLSFHRGWRPTHTMVWPIWPTWPAIPKWPKLPKRSSWPLKNYVFVKTQVLMTSTGQGEFPLLERVRSLLFCFLQHVIWVCLSSGACLSHNMLRWDCSPQVGNAHFKQGIFTSSRKQSLQVGDIHFK